MKQLRAVVPAIALLVSTVLTASPAHAATTTLTVVGTSDVYDSYLVQNVIKPGFEADHPEYTLNYVSKGTGAAIDYAKQGTAAAMIVHAMSLENQFVADGYSYEPYGRAIFWGDYVLAGPADDPAGVLSGGEHDIAAAFEKIAAAGAEDKAVFVSRGGTPGTTVQEHAIWAMTSGVQTCNVTTADGGGTTPSTTTGDCPSIGSVSKPDWYKATGKTQAPNIQDADVCNYDQATDAGRNVCYVFTDRGTLQYLQGSGSVTTMTTLTRDNDATARGSEAALVNTFHAYVVNPAKFTSSTNTDVVGATALLDWITSVKGQAAIGAYQQPDPSFLPSARPEVTVTKPPATVRGGQKVTLTGSIANVVPGMPTLDGVPVHLISTPAAGPGITSTEVASAFTDASGNFTLSYVPRTSATLSVTTGAITKIEDADLEPDFGDQLQATSTTAGSVTVAAAVGLTKPKVSRHKITLRGAIAPPAGDAKGTVTIWAGKVGGRLKARKSVKLGTGASAYKAVIHLPRGRWKVRVVYADGMAVTPATSVTRRVRIR
ncbi:MAG: substrate-binding domain-containing protein [Nocardioides sp.]|uniref:substrate-binding domain-containing protein n=1 Tax=Nocardioides sp. TaxID=35761 RepID=UPI0039E25CA3